ncbi:glycerol-3-phosphate acyltransferase [Papillibacter cinnamivorans]|uniref:Glycerol-3-phosphate acyltransferase n=1 Tax=Papillibacter cinnamivorans DSM 12816 TaxID=1122930 RepID=A0A1W1YNB8_9FIRM|nr:glycerol-3-phosphate acyltransferase [Papillibacter cinnamivorans]SMC37301.1 glycerol-3-phosphate acyltransferase PlsY [Papillibacter cinnamivorans DSM 12816]
MQTLYLYALIVAVVSYLLGCFNGSIIVSKYILKNDIRSHGSGNAGLTNFYRSFGGGLTALVLLGDILKAVLAYFFGRWLMGSLGFAVGGEFLACFFVMLGHTFPVFFGFKGGKGVLSGGTLVALIDLRIFAVVIIAFLVMVVLTRYISLGSIMAAVFFPFAAWFFWHSPFYTFMTVLCSAMLIFMHRGNLTRIKNGTESRFSFRRKKSP